MNILKTKYLGLELKSPIIAGSCGMTNSIEHLVELEKAGAGAIVLKSIFEEQIINEISQNIMEQNLDFMYPEAIDYIANYTEMYKLEEYIAFIREAKKSVAIPIIASINCSSAGEWTKYAKKIQDAGADAIELNIFVLPANVKITSDQYENQYFAIVDSIKKHVSIPIAVKTSVYFSAFAKMIEKLSWSGVNGFVMFNRFYSPDIDIENFKITSANVFSKGDEYTLPLRWTAILHDVIKSDICASTGIHDGETAIKMILAGANAVQVASALYKPGFQVITDMNNTIENWMERHNYKSVEEFRGKMSYKNIENPSAYQRIQFMKYFSGIE
ncbi:MAG: dihydroorotate dehydrogenase-like protein [Bacteroidota bacterium]